MGRYAYCNQPAITKWNLSRFAECLIPLIDEDEDKAVKSATELIETFGERYEKKWLNMMRKKLGLLGVENEDKFLIVDLLTWMHQKKVDYTNTFCHLMNIEIEKNKNYKDSNFQNWKKRWQERLNINNNTPEKNMKIMRSVNPLIIPRNQKVEEALEAAENDNFNSINQLIEVLKEPYSRGKNILEYQISSNYNENYQTFCGT